MEKFNEKIKQLEKEIMDKLKNNTNIIMTNDDWKDFSSSTKCYLLFNTNP